MQSSRRQSIVSSEWTHCYETETNGEKRMSVVKDPLAQFGLDAIDLRWTLKDIDSKRNLLINKDHLLKRSAMTPPLLQRRAKLRYGSASSLSYTLSRYLRSFSIKHATTKRRRGKLATPVASAQS
jgi:hypothetical protein